MNRRKQPEPELFWTVPQRRTGWPERPDVYRRILALRRAGITCYRCGGHSHLVGGRMLSTHELKRLVP